MNFEQRSEERDSSMHDVLQKIKELRVRGQSQEGLDLFPTDWNTNISDPALQARFTLERGLCHYNLGHYRAAYDDIRELRDLLNQPREAAIAPEEELEMVTSIAWMMERYGSLSDVSALLDERLQKYRGQAVLQTVSGAYLRWHLGWTKYRAGDWKEGIEELKEAHSTLQTLHHADAWCILLDMAEVYLKSNDPESARDTLKQIQPSALGARMKIKYHRHHALLFFKEGKLAEAVQEVSRASTWAAMIDDRLEMAETALLEGEIKKERDGTLSDPFKEQIRKTCREANDGTLMARAMFLLS